MKRTRYSNGKAINLVLKVSNQSDGTPEIFRSIQGEGVNIGMPTVFLRLAQCNLMCSWCDTKYTWDWDNYDYESEVHDMSDSEVEDVISGFDCKHLVITGGEPLIQARQLVPLAQSLKSLGYFIEVETNGTLVPDDGLSGLVDQWNVSPKLANSANALNRRESSHALRFFAELPNAYFKYVVNTPDDLLEILDLNSRYGIAESNTILMPQAENCNELDQKSGWIVELCKQSGFRFSTRLHVILWGAKRGV